LTDPEAYLRPPRGVRFLSGSGEPTDLSATLPKDEKQAAGISESVVDLAKAMVRVLQPGWRVESEDELKQRLSVGGVEFDADDFATALAVLEGDGAPGGFGTGAIPALTIASSGSNRGSPRTNQQPYPAKPILLESLRLY